MMDKIKMNNAKMEAEIFFQTHLPDALRLAIEYAGEDGFVASTPQLLHARANADFSNKIWNTWFFTANSEESLAQTRQGTPVAVMIHGGGIFATPARFRKLYLSSVNRRGKTGFSGLFGAKITAADAQGITEGRLPDGSAIPVFSYDEIRRGVDSLPRRYAIVMDFETAKGSKHGYASFDELKDDPLMIARAGGAEAAAAYLDKAKAYYGTDVMGSWHRFGHMNPGQYQTYIHFLFDCLAGASDTVGTGPQSRMQGDSDSWFTHYRVSRDSGFGLRADSAMINMARYVAVAPRNEVTSVRNLSFAA